MRSYHFNFRESQPDPESLMKTIEQRRIAYHRHIRRHETVQKKFVEGKVDHEQDKGLRRTSRQANIEGGTLRRSTKFCQVALTGEDGKPLHPTCGKRRDSGKVG